MDRTTSLLDWVDQFPETEEIVRQYDKKAGVCLLCTCLFDSIASIEENYKIDLSDMLAEMQDIAKKK